MRLLYVADLHCPTACNWIQHFIQEGHEVHIVSSFPVDPVPGAKSLHILPLGFSGFGSRHTQSAIARQRKVSLLSSTLNLVRHGAAAQMAMDVRYQLAAIDLYRHVSALQKIADNIQPDLIHAMRIPLEGIVAALGAREFPLLVSVWGNDFTLFAKRYALIAAQTRKTLRRADALHCDCHRDLRLAPAWGFDTAKPSIVLPGAGGVQPAIFHPGPPDDRVIREAGFPAGAPVVIQPRGFRGYVRNDTFFNAIPIVLRERPEARFVCSAMAGNPVAEKWVERLGIAEAVRLLPVISREQMAAWFRMAAITVSPSLHDGTPNTLLEAMACGCFPVAGDIETAREWIDHGVNGLLCDPTDAKSIAAAILEALNDGDLRKRAQVRNLELIEERAEYGRCMTRAGDFYSSIVSARRQVERALP